MIICLVLSFATKIFLVGCTYDVVVNDERRGRGHNFNFLTSWLSYICTSSCVPSNLNDENPKNCSQKGAKTKQRSSTGQEHHRTSNTGVVVVHMK